MSEMVPPVSGVARCAPLPVLRRRVLWEVR